MMAYTVTSTHELTPAELARAPRGLKRSSIEVAYSRKSEAVEAFKYQLWFLAQVGFTDRVELRRGKVLLGANGRIRQVEQHAGVRGG